MVRGVTSDMERVTRRQILGTLATVFASGLGVSAQTPTVVRVYKDPTCGCCGLWVEHLRRGGFTATVTEVDDMSAIKTKHGVPPRVGSCHTALVGTYVVAKCSSRMARRDLLDSTAGDVDIAAAPKRRATSNQPAYPLSPAVT